MPSRKWAHKLAVQKCYLTQGVAWVQTALIFFLGGRSVQEWTRAHCGWTVDITWPILGSLATAWVLGWALFRTGVVSEEQSVYIVHNRELRERLSRNGDTNDNA